MIILARKYAQKLKEAASIAQQKTLKPDIFVSTAFPESNAANQTDQ